jgi:hypothetical protein
MNVYTIGVIWVAGTAALAAGISILLHSSRSTESEVGNDAVRAVFSVVGGLNAVLMAFVLISQFDTVSTVRKDSQIEANSLVAVYWASDSLAEPARGQIQEQVRSYTRNVIEREWPRLREGNPDDAPGWALLTRMRTIIDSAPAGTEWAQLRKADMVSQVWQVYESRQARLNAASNAGVSTVVWLALVAVSILAVSIPYLFSGSTRVTHAVVTASLAGTIALLIFAIYQLQNPFGGGASVGPDAFMAVVDEFNSSSAG